MCKFSKCMIFTDNTSISLIMVHIIYRSNNMTIIEKLAIVYYCNKLYIIQILEEEKIWGLLLQWNWMSVTTPLSFFFLSLCWSLQRLLLNWPWKLYPEVNPLINVSTWIKPAMILSCDHVFIWTVLILYLPAGNQGEKIN